MTRVLEAAVVVDREALVYRLRENGELEHLRARFEPLRVLANTHEAEINEWSRRVGRPLHVPGITFPWPPAPAWDALLDAPVQAPRLLWDDDPDGPGA